MVGLGENNLKERNTMRVKKNATNDWPRFEEESFRRDH
jgi:hypothetical protein